MVTYDLDCIYLSCIYVTGRIPIRTRQFSQTFKSSNILERYYTGIKLIVSLIFGGIFKYRVLLHKNVNTYFCTGCRLRNFITSNRVMSVASEICGTWKDFCYVNCLPRKRQRSRIQLCSSKSINTLTLTL